MLLFPAGTTFSPYTVIRNISDQTVSIAPKLYYMQGAAPQSVQLPSLTILPYETVDIHLPSLIANSKLKSFNGSVNLVLDFESKFRALLIASGSVDQKNTYVFEVHPQAVVESIGKTISYWSTGNGDDTMITLWNPADEAQNLVFTLFFSGGHYKLPVHLGPKSTQMFNISEIIHNQIPDDENNIVPSSIREGSAEIGGSQGEDEHILVVMDAGTYNVQKATCSQWCVTCNGTVDVWIAANPFSLGVSTQSQLTATVQYNTGAKYDKTRSSSWSSSAQSIATVNAGLVSGVSEGSANMTASDDFTPDYTHACFGYNPDGVCPVVVGFQTGGSGTVCNFTVFPANIVAQNCTGQTANSNNFNTTITPSQGCISGPQSTCSATHTGNIDFAVGYPQCNFTSGQASATVQYFAGPPLPPPNSQFAGTITMDFNLQFGNPPTFVNRSVNATVQCP